MFVVVFPTNCYSLRRTNFVNLMAVAQFLTGSHRGELIRHRSRGDGMRHASDFNSGTSGCYYCWKGEFHKCRELCQLLPRPVHGGNFSAAGTIRSMDRNIFDDATPRLTKLHRNNKDVRASNGPATSRSATPTQRSLSVRSRRSPLQSRTLYHHTRASELIQVTPYTTASVAPATHCYLTRNERFVSKDNAIWSGKLAKGGQGGFGEDARSKEVARRMALANHDAAHQPRRNRQTVSSARGLIVTHDVVASDVLSCKFRSAMDMPLPDLFL